MPDLSRENQLREEGFTLIVGIDEAGRGPLAGPVVAAAVALPPNFSLAGLDDSKKLSAKKRTQLYEHLTGHSEILWACEEASVSEIDRLNILRASHLAMKRAAESLPCDIDFALIDGLPVPDFPLPHRGIVKGDSLSLSIAAASILAKVTRDRFMERLDRDYPNYGFAKHKGYGTKDHLTRLRTYGPCEAHRRSFQPVAQLALPLEDKE